MKKSVQKEEAQRNMYISLCIVALVALIGYGAFSVADAFVVDQPKMLDSKQVAALGRTHYRFREIYRGPKMETNRSTSAAPVVSASHSRLSSGSHVASSSAAASPANGSVSMSGASASSSVLHTTSSAEPHAYGGGGAMGGMTGGTSSASAVPMQGSIAAVSPSFRSTSVSRKPAHSSSLPSDEEFLVSGPRRIGGDEEGFGDGEDGEDLGDDFIPTPVGDVPFLALLFLVVAYLIYRKKKSASLA